MYTQEIIDLRKEIDNHELYMDKLIEGYDAIQSAASIKTEDKALVSDNYAYASLVSIADNVLSAEVGSVRAVLPSNLNELDMEGFKARFKEVSGTVWKAISEATEKFLRLLRSWFNKIKDMITGSIGSGDDPAEAIEAIRKAIHKSDEALKKYGYRRGDKVPPSEQEKIEEAEDVDLMLTTGDKVLSFEDFEKNVVDVLPELKSKANLLSAITIDSKVDNIHGNIQDGLENLKQMTEANYLNNVIVYLRNMTNIRDRKELNKFLDKDRAITSEAFREMVKELRLEGGEEKPGSRWYTKEMMGGVKFSVAYNKKGNFVYPDTNRQHSKVKVSSFPQVTLTQLIAASNSAMEISEIVANSAKNFDIIGAQLEQLTASRGKKLEEISKVIMDAASDREKADVKVILSELKSLNTILKGWTSINVRITESCTNIRNSIIQLSAEVSSGFDKQFNLSRKKKKRK